MRRVLPSWQLPARYVPCGCAPLSTRVSGLSFVLLGLVRGEQYQAGASERSHWRAARQSAPPWFLLPEQQLSQFASSVIIRSLSPSNLAADTIPQLRHHTE